MFVNFISVFVVIAIAMEVYVPVLAGEKISPAEVMNVLQVKFEKSISAEKLLEFKRNVARLDFDKDRELILIDWKQDRSPSFVQWLLQRGFSYAKCLEGGIDAWADKIDPSIARYEIDEDDGYRYEDIFEDDPGDEPNEDHHDH